MRIRIEIKLTDDSNGQMVRVLDAGATDLEDAKTIMLRTVFQCQETAKRMIETPVFEPIPKVEPITIAAPAIPVEPWNPLKPLGIPMPMPYTGDPPWWMQPITISNGIVVEDPNKPISMASGASDVPPLTEHKD